VDQNGALFDAFVGVMESASHLKAGRTAHVKKRRAANITSESSCGKRFRPVDSSLSLGCEVRRPSLESTRNDERRCCRQAPLIHDHDRHRSRSSIRGHGGGSARYGPQNTRERRNTTYTYIHTYSTYIPYVIRVACAHCKYTVQLARPKVHGTRCCCWLGVLGWRPTTRV